MFLIISKLGGMCQWCYLINVLLIVEWKTERAETKERLPRRYQGLKKKKDGLREVRVSQRNESGSDWVCEGARFRFYVTEARSQMRWCTWAQPGRRLTPLKTRRGTNTIPFIQSVKVEHWILVKGAGNIARRERRSEREHRVSAPAQPAKEKSHE